MHQFHNTLADQIKVEGDYKSFNGFGSIHEALLELSDEYQRLSPVQQCFTSQYVWAILHERDKGNSTIDFDEMTDNMYDSRITTEEMRSTDFDYLYYELDPTTTDFRISDELDNEVCVLNIRTMLMDKTIDSPSMKSIHDGLVKLGHIQDEDLLVVRTPENVVDGVQEEM
ncbi:MAG: hypothetical protein JXR12_01200 [Neptunomonas phycophila]|uniref:hypothetical protein n=1 Tax=Neptunomonas phycophila TaxID=1572645 RepID=UPI003B8CCD59